MQTLFLIPKRYLWLIVCTALALMYIPTFIGLSQGIWMTDEQAHGPIVLLVSIWLLYRKWPAFSAFDQSDIPSSAGWPVFACALFFYIIGRSQSIHSFEIFSLILMLISLVLLFMGIQKLKLVWFPLFFMCFMIPLPGPLVQAVTMPMKLAVSYVAEHLLYWLGYPIARNGVLIQIGQYELLVADACAGLHTLFSLEAVGLLYLNIVRHPSTIRNIALALLIVPISFTANVIRVVILSLITYYMGDAAGQGFLHGFAGIVLFLSALLLIVVVDTLLRVAFQSHKTFKPA